MLVVALVLRAWLGLEPAAPVHLDAAALGWGLCATVPPLAFLLWSMQTSWGPLQRLHARVMEFVRVAFAHANWVDILLASLLAGVAEELLFRGVIQAWLSERIGFGWAVLAASVAFGLAHPVSLAYIAAVVGIGLYLGVLLQISGNLVLPIVVHALYDLVALLVFVRNARRQPTPPESSQAALPQRE